MCSVQVFIFFILLFQGQNSFKVPVHVCVAHAKNYQHTRGDMSLEHVPLHFLACVHIVILLLLHVPAPCPLSVNNTWFCCCYMSLQLVPATCPHVCRDLKTNVLPVFWYCLYAPNPSCIFFLWLALTQVCLQLHVASTLVCLRLYLFAFWAILYIEIYCTLYSVKILEYRNNNGFYMYSYTLFID